MGQNKEVKDYYDKFPYFSAAFVDSSPIRLHAIAKFLKARPTPTKTARVLEIGGSYGGNILPFAVHNKDAEVIGIDISKTQVNIGNEIALQMGVKNFQMLQKDILSLSDENIKLLGKFDYIIAHGFYSWVKDNVKNALLAMIKILLKPHGVAFVSYNTYPGWHSLDIMRDFMLFVSKEKKGVRKLEISKNELEFFADFVKANLPYAKDEIYIANLNMLKVQLEFLHEILKEGKNDYYISHEFLEPTNDAVYFYEFAQKLKILGLSHLSEASLDDIFFPGIGIGKYDNHINANFKSKVDREQMRDFMLNRSFRKSIIVHKENVDSEQDIQIGIDDFVGINFIAKITQKDDKFYIKDEVLNSKFEKFYKKAMKLYPSSVGLKNFDGKVCQDGMDAFLSIISNSNVILTGKKFQCLRYEAGKTRLKECVVGYVSYFASTKKPVILMANEFNEKVELDDMGAKVALLFDGKNSIDDIVTKFRLLFQKEFDTDVNISDANEYVLKVKESLENAFFLEKF
ncbi:MAG: methyltransferase regulatory domain-containing protein [Campylobacter sp.]|nr:methyltransferase regulatory domain-containing protein [Campylobacter sp.]